MADSLGDRIKDYEARECERKFMPLLPVYARIDGRCFSAFTRGMDRPWDERMTACMVATARRLVDETHARAAYTQSDEISLLWFSDDPQTAMLFGGKAFKLTSVLASLATSIFISEAAPIWPERFAKKPVSFDCRAFQLPTRDEAANAFLWRELDATKNAISMAARAHFSHAKLQDKNGAEMQEMLFQEAGVNFNDYPARFKRGTFILRRTMLKALDAEVLARIPEQHRPAGPIERQVTMVADMPKFSTIKNRVEVLFDGAEPILALTGSPETSDSVEKERA